MNKKRQSGFTLIEVLLAIVLLGVIGLAVFGTLGTASKALITTDERETAKNIAEMQIEYIKSQLYMPTYAPRSLAEYPGYSVSITAQNITDRGDGNIQKVIVDVYHDPNYILTLVGYKVR
jgi:prepilin-type N-terminal cleavage/methylation domain-containing protein